MSTQLSTLKLEGVPLLAQRWSDENGTVHGTNLCWYASACMVNKFFEFGPRQGIPKKQMNNERIGPQEFITLAKAEHLVATPSANLWTESSLFNLLSQFGPIWAAGYWFGDGHVVVLTGVSPGYVYFNDPWNPDRNKGNISWFNKQLASSFPGCLMRRSGQQAPKGGWKKSPCG